MKPGQSSLLEDWFEREILPLYGRHLELARQSLKRKAGALRLSVEAALSPRLRHAGRTAQTDGSEFRRLETDWFGRSSYPVSRSCDVNGRS